MRAILDWAIGMRATTRGQPRSTRAQGASKQLAERSGIDQAEISRIERGQANPTTATLGALTGALGLDVQLVPGHRAA
jgi:transcriptional regulator with XRE-family HTH domain